MFIWEHIVVIVYKISGWSLSTLSSLYGYEYGCVQLIFFVEKYKKMSRKDEQTDKQIEEKGSKGKSLEK